MADLPKLVEALSKLTALEAAELAKLLEVRWHASKVSGITKARVINFYMDDSGAILPGARISAR
jgi:Ribosomal protein L7/L12 dimerisation domain